ncbi:MAG: hemerythrin domain-containing protein [Sandaracinus sp.]
MGEEHARLRALLEQVLDAFDTNNPAWAASSYAELERTLSEHLATEEEHVFPLLSERAPRELEALQTEHAEIRKRLAALGVAVDLHAVRADAIHEFVALLRDHAAREDALAYRHADDALESSVRRRVIARLRQRLESLTGREAVPRSAAREES